MLPTLGPLEIGIIVVLAVVIFGAGKLPELGGALGKATRDFRSATKEVREIKEEVQNSVSLDPLPKKKAEAKKEVESKEA